MSLLLDLISDIISYYIELCDYCGRRERHCPGMLSDDCKAHAERVLNKGK